MNFLLTVTSLAQICTLTGTGTINWNNATNYACSEGGNLSGASVLVIPVGLTVNFNDNADTWTGARIDVLGTLEITAPGSVTINASVVVKNGGELSIDSKLSLGTSGGCNYTIIIENGGLMEILGGASDRLNICGNEIVKGGGGGCNPNYPLGDPTYCYPSGGFTGPTGFDEDGHNGTLPVTLLDFSLKNIDNKNVLVLWATATEKDSEHFIIERSFNGKDFTEIGKVQGSGTTNIRHDYSFIDRMPFIGRTYYRLKQVDFDGTFKYFGIKFIDVTGKKSVTVFPNPVVSEDINIRLNYSSDEIAMVRIFDISGLEVSRFSFSGNEFKNPINLPAGSYLVKINAGTEAFVARFVVR